MILAPTHLHDVINFAVFLKGFPKQLDLGLK